MKGAGDFAGRREVVIGLGSYAAYLLVRKLVWNDSGRRRAAANARRLVTFEQRCRVDVEPVVQRVALRWPLAVHALNVGYAAGNVALNVGWLMLLYHRRDPAFTRVTVSRFLLAIHTNPPPVATPSAPG